MARNRRRAAGLSVSVALPPDLRSHDVMSLPMMVDMDCAVISTPGTEADTSTDTSDRTSVRPQRIELITRGERRRRWSLEEKQAIVAESLAPNASLTAVARRHEIGTGLLYAWRHQLLGRRSGEAACFACVDVISEPHRLRACNDLSEERWTESLRRACRYGDLK